MSREQANAVQTAIPDEPAWQSSKEGLFLVVMVALDDETDEVSYTKNGELTLEELPSFFRHNGLMPGEFSTSASFGASIHVYDHTGTEIFARDVFGRDA